MNSESSQPPSDQADPPSQPPASASSSTAQIDYSDTEWARWKNWVNAVVGRFDEPTHHSYVSNYDDREEDRDIKRCEENRDYVLKWSPQLRFMREKIEKLGGGLHSGNMKCMKCTALKGSGFEPNYGIQLCANRLRERAAVEDCLAHELVHAYDHLRFHVDWGTNLKHAACAEIRATSLSGECRFWREYFTNPHAKFVTQHQACVRRRAQLSLMARPNCSGEKEAAKAVNEAWESCFADTRPFDEIYK